MDAGNRIKVMLDDFAYMPERAYSSDAGMDLKSPITVIIPAGQSKVIDSGVHVGIPEGYVGMLKSKSGLNIKYGITSEGVIDAGYTGSIVIKLYNFGERDIMVERGDKISQLVILPIMSPQLEVVSKLDESERMDNGFGSTGK